MVLCRIFIMTMSVIGSCFLIYRKETVIDCNKTKKASPKIKSNKN